MRKIRKKILIRQKTFYWHCIFWLYLWFANFAAATTPTNLNNKNILKIYAPSSLAQFIQTHLQQEFEATQDCQLVFKAATTLNLETSITERQEHIDLILGLNYDQLKQPPFAAALQHLDLQQLVINKQLPSQLTIQEVYLLPLYSNYLSFLYHKNMVATPLDSFAALTQGPHKIILVDPRTSSLGQSLLYWVAQTQLQHSRQFWQQLQPHLLTITKNWGQAYQLFLKREAAIVLSYTQSQLYHQLQEQRDDIAASYFQEGQYQEISVAAIPKHSKQPQLAIALLRTMLSAPIQTAIALHYLGQPVVPNLAIPPAFYHRPHLIQARAFPSLTVMIQAWLDALS
jgi:thiamine transport system substrate-binding protein